MIETQELYTKWLREYPGAERFSTELTGRHPYEWKVSSGRSHNFDYVLLSGAMINGTEQQNRRELCRQLSLIMTALG